MSGLSGPPRSLAVTSQEAMALRHRPSARSAAAIFGSISEKEFLQQIRDLAHLFGWQTYHPLWSRGSESGWPDLTLVRGSRLIFAELKVATKLTEPQRRWLCALARTGNQVYLWKPDSLERIAVVLR